MDKEKIELLEKLNNNLGDFINIAKMQDNITNAIKTAWKEKAKLSIEKNEDGKTNVNIEGSLFAILIALAGLEKTVMNKLDVDYGMFEVVKSAVGTEEVKCNE